MVGNGFVCVNVCMKVWIVSLIDRYTLGTLSIAVSQLGGGIITNKFNLTAIFPYVYLPSEHHTASTALHTALSSNQKSDHS